MTRKSSMIAVADRRHVELRRSLESRRREILGTLQGRMRDVRALRASGEGVLDIAETAEADVQDDIEFALIQMKSETLHKIEEALARLDRRTYGSCNECGDDISERRLDALPFAVRCRDCEQTRELAKLREQHLFRHRPTGVMFDSH